MTQPLSHPHRLPSVRYLVAFLVVLAAGLMGGCGGKSVASNSNTLVRVIDAMQTTGNSPVNVNGDFTFFGNGIVFGQVTNYGSASNQQMQVSVVRSGNGVQLAEGTFTFAPNTKTTLLLTGSEGNSTNFVPTITALTDNTSHPANGDFKVRIINASQIANGPVDLYLLPDQAALNTASPVISGVDYGTASNYVEALVNTGSNPAPFVVAIVPTGQKAPLIAPFFNYIPVNGEVDTIFLHDNGVATVINETTP